ncbi:NAD(P)-binding protein [Hypoxylon sp. NC1633]|nr:NAD(P)-binding protein [Hypoxylon sp. NC1633]
MSSKIALNDGVALITGAASGIGKETAFAFAEAGVRAITFADINEQGAHEAAEESKKYARHASYRSLAIKVNIADEDSVQTMVDTTVKEFGRIDFGVNSAGMGNISGAITPNLKLDVFSKTIETNIKGTMLCVRALTKVMAEQEPLSYTSRHGTRSLGRGSIINVASVNSYVAAPGMLSYTTSKHALIGLTKSAAIDTMKSYIRVNAVCPSWVDTPMNHASLQRVPQLAQIIKAVSPLQRVAVTEEVADYIVFLCSPSASYINGTSLVIDAGASLTAHVG